MSDSVVTVGRTPVAGVVVISGEGMRVAEWVPGRAEDVLVLDYPPLPDAKELRGPSASHPRGVAQAGTGARSGRQRDLHESKVDRHRQAFLKDAAGEIEGIAMARGWRVLVVLGESRLASAVTSVVRDSIPVVEAGHGAQWLSPTALADVVAPEIERALADEQAALIERIRGEALSGGRGAIGPDDCRTTAGEGRVELLVIDRAHAEAAAIEDAVIGQGGQVEEALEASRATLDEIGGACALLRW